MKTIVLIVYYFFLFSFVKIKSFAKSNFIEKPKKFLSKLFRSIVRGKESTINTQTIIVNHIYAVYPNVENFLNLTFQNFQDKNFLVLKNSNITSLRIDSKEFRILAENFLQNLRRTLGKKIYEEIENYWGEEEFKEFVMLWLYYKISKDLANNIRNLMGE